MKPSSVQVVYNSEWGCIVNTISGTITQEVASEAANKIAQLAKLHNCIRCLNDVREATSQLSITNLYYLPDKVAELGVGRSMKRAILVKERFEESSFYEDTTANKGIRVKVFTDLDEALNWLH